MKFVIENKTFKVENGVAYISMFDKQSRITKLMKKAKEYGFEVKFTK